MKSTLFLMMGFILCLTRVSEAQNFSGGADDQTINDCDFSHIIQPNQNITDPVSNMDPMAISFKVYSQDCHTAPGYDNLSRIEMMANFQPGYYYNDPDQLIQVVIKQYPSNTVVSTDTFTRAHAQNHSINKKILKKRYLSPWIVYYAEVTFTNSIPSGNVYTGVCSTNVFLLDYHCISPITLNCTNTPENCLTQTKGSISVGATQSPSTAPLTYVLKKQVDNSIVAQNSTGSFTNLNTGNYYVTVTDTFTHPTLVRNTATCSTSVGLVNSPITLSCTSTNENCLPLNDGTIHVVATQSPAYTLSYTLKKASDNSIVSQNGTGNFTGLMAGSYVVSVTDNTCDVATCSVNVGLTNNVSISMSSLNLPSYACINAPPIVLSGETPATGTFSGPGISGGSVFTAKDAGSGLKTLTYSVAPARAGCNNSATVNILVLEKPKYINRVISATAIPFTDLWPVDFSNTSSNINSGSLLTNYNQLIANQSFNNGSKGVWRGQETYVYVEDRKQRTPTGLNPNVNIKTDGVYDTLPLYMYNQSEMAGCYPGWRKMNTMTRYNPYNNQSENKDILNRYSAALYGYSGNLSTAVAANAAESEIAFNGFEENGPSLSLTDVSASNLTVVTSAPSSTSNMVYREFEVSSASGNILTITASSTIISNLNGKTIKVWGAAINDFNNKDVFNSTDSTYTVSSVNPATSTITLGGSFPYSFIWKGKISYTDTYTPVFDFSAGSAAVVSSTSLSPGQSHTGKSSLSVTGTIKAELYKLNLTPGNTYVLSGWVKSLGVNDSTTYQSPSGASVKRGLSVLFYTFSGTPVAANVTDILPVEPQGNIVEGWQRVEGTFTVPITPVPASRIVLVLNAGADVTLMDDIRIYPLAGSMQTYVYNKENYRVSAVLDNNNYATFYYYDDQGNLFLVKKETEKGIQTVQESFGHQRER